MGEYRWAPVTPIATSVAAAAVSVAGAFLVRRTDDLGQFGGPVVYIAGMVGLVFATYRAVWSRARHFAALGVPVEWTRPPLRGLRDPDLRRWDATIRQMRYPLPDDRDKLLAAARARAEGLLSIEVPGGLAVLGFVGIFVVAAHSPYTMLSSMAVRDVPLPIILACWVMRLDLNGARARAYLDRFGTV